MSKKDNPEYKVARDLAKRKFKHKKAAAKYNYKQEKSRLKYELHKDVTPENPKPDAKRTQQTKNDIYRAKSQYKNIVAEEKLLYLNDKYTAKQTYKKSRSSQKEVRNPTSLSYALALAFVLVFFVIIAMQEVFVLWAVQYVTGKQNEEQLDTVFSTLKAADFSESAAKAAQVNDISYIGLYDQEGEAVYQLGESALLDVTTEKEVQKIRAGTHNYLVLQRQTKGGTAYIAKDMSDQDNLFALLLVVMSVATVLAAIASGVVGISVSQRTLRPVHSMGRMMKEMTVGDLSARLDTKKIHTELRDVAASYNGMMDRLEESYARQAQFVSDASHELRTPLSVISGYGDILERWGSEDPEVLREAIQSINTQCAHVNALLERLLTLSRLDHALPTPHPEQIDLYPLLSELQKDFSLVAGDKRIEVDAPKNQQVVCDSGMLRQSLVIFLDNAMKFTGDKGHITLFSREKEDEIHVGVRDDGIGIEPAQLEKIFDRFYKADTARGEKGYGLGLSIAAKLSQAMNIQIGVKSVAKQGSEFYLRLK